jgi:DNA-binding response OmpR family regulator
VGNGAKRPTKILMLVSDAELVTQLQQLNLLEDEFVTERAEGAQEALRLALEDSVDITLLDVHLSEIGGHLMCRLLRSKGVNHAIIMLSSSESDAEVILGFESGASDFVTGPLNIKTFVARLRAHARQSEKEELITFKFGPYLFNFADNSLLDSRHDRRVHLTLKEAVLLRYLCRHKGKAVHRDELLRNVWEWNPSSFTHTLESHIYRLRRKLEPDPRHPVFILSAPAGYQLVCSP